MQPLHELLHRIKWDAEFGRGTFALAYDDRVALQERVIPFASIAIDPGAFSFSFCDEDEVVAHIPLHRVRAVYKDGAVIWQRRARPEGTAGTKGSD
jgi:uncharacterized protein (UPF0248 family)